MQEGLLCSIPTDSNTTMKGVGCKLVHLQAFASKHKKKKVKVNTQCDVLCLVVFQFQPVGEISLISFILLMH